MTAPPRAVPAVLENAILCLNRFDLEKASVLAEILLRDDTLWRIATPMDVVRTAVLRDAFNRGMSQIRRNAPASAVAEFKRALRIWEASYGQHHSKAALKARAATQN